MKVILTVDLSRINALARSNMGLVTLQEYKHALHLGDEYELLRKMKFAKKKRGGGK